MSLQWCKINVRRIKPIDFNRASHQGKAIRIDPGNLVTQCSRKQPLFAHTVALIY